MRHAEVAATAAVDVAEPVQAPAAAWLVRSLGLVDYEETFAAMRRFSMERAADTPDELWFAQHAPVFTLGLAARTEHVLAAGDIPVVPTDRGGQVTYHGPGQLLAYPLLDLRRRGYFVKEYVFRLEEAVLAVLRHLGVTGHRVPGAPGVYVRVDDPFSHARLTLPTSDTEPALRWQGLGKIAALGIKVHRANSYHGLALNVAMDLAPFARINPCGYVGLHAVDLRSLGVLLDIPEAQALLERKLRGYLG